MPIGTVSRTSIRYKHPEFGKDIPIGIAGFYTPIKEVRLPYLGREVLYLVSKSVLESSCCGTGSWLYATVPGYILQWQVDEENGQPVSEIQPLQDNIEREGILRIIEERENTDFVLFS
jgi:hypothetical protein